jgi:hypothetical protein
LPAERLNKPEAMVEAGERRGTPRRKIRHMAGRVPEAVSGWSRAQLGRGSSFWLKQQAEVRVKFQCSVIC